MNIIIAGSGKFGTMLTRKLVEEGHNITLIDNDFDVLEDSNEEYDIISVHGNCASMETLREAGVNAGVARFAEFSNLLFLKLISELNVERSYNISRNYYYRFS